MIGPYFWRDRELRPAAEAVVPADDINFSYGFGVYETMKVRGGFVYFPERHTARLLESARIIELPHEFSQEFLMDALQRLCRANEIENANLKLLLIGGETAAEAKLYILALAPLYPPRRSHRDGVAVITVEAERQYPQAKSLSMLTSTVAFRRARAAGAFDALLQNREGIVTEGTRTNLFYTDGTRLFTPPAHQVLSGVTRATVIEALERAGVEVEERELAAAELRRFAGFFLTSSSSKVVPIGLIDGRPVPIPEIVRRAARVYDAYLKSYRRSLEAGIPAADEKGRPPR